MEKRLVKIGEAARLLGTSVAQLRNWEATGELLPARKTKGGTRYYDVAAFLHGYAERSESEPLSRRWSDVPVISR